MYDKDAAFDPMWVAPQYPPLKPEDRGVWRRVLDDTDEPVGLVWSNHSDSAGVLWLTQIPVVTELFKYFSVSADGYIPAYAAYVNAASQPGVKLGPEQSGPLSRALEDLDAIEHDIDEASS